MAKGNTSFKVPPPPPPRRAPDRSDAESSYSSTSEDVTEDEDGLELTPALDAAILRTLGKIRRGEGVHGAEKVLEEELGRAEKEAERRGVRRREHRTEEKPFLLADYHRQTLLSGQIPEDYDNDDDHSYAPDQPLTHVQSQYRLKKEAVAAFSALAAEDSDDEGDFVPVKRAGTKGGAEGVVKTGKGEGEDEGLGEEEEYRRFLLDMGGGEEEVRELLKTGATGSGFREDTPEGEEGLADGKTVKEEKKIKEGKKSKKEKKEKENEKGKGNKLSNEERTARKAKEDDDFLMNYILNRGWIDRTADKVPTYEDIVGRPVNGDGVEDGRSEDGDVPGAGPSHPWGKLDEEDEFDDKADEFEAAYNFRFEEPGSSDIHTHPRAIPGVVRRADDARKTKRTARAERKAAEQAAKDEETRRLKGEKRREMDKRLASLKKDVRAGFDWEEVEKLMEGEYEEEGWGRVMGRLMDNMRDIDDDEDDDDEKPTWDEDIGDAEYDEPDEGHQVNGEVAYEDDVFGDEDFDEGPINMDADFIDEPAPKKSKKERKGKGKHRDDTADGVEDEADADGHLTVVEKADKIKRAAAEYKALDHEDMIGDMPTRFKYARTAPSSFGLTPVEILLATDAELNAIASVKHIAPYRQGGLGMAGKGLGKRVRELKDELRARKWGEENQNQNQSQSSSGAGARARDSGWPRKGGEGSGEGKRPGKRMGKKERMKAKVAAGLAGEMSVEHAGEKRKEAPAKAVSAPELKRGGEGGDDGGGGEGERKKKRRKKKHGHEGAGGVVV